MFVRQFIHLHDSPSIRLPSRLYIRHSVCPSGHIRINEINFDTIESRDLVFGKPGKVKKFYDTISFSIFQLKFQIR